MCRELCSPEFTTVHRRSENHTGNRRIRCAALPGKARDSGVVGDMTAGELPGAAAEDGEARRTGLPTGHVSAETSGELQEMIAAACDGFTLILQLLERCEARRDDLFAAYAFAAGAAAEGRNILACAFSLPVAAPVAIECDGASTAAIACFVALLADVLSGLLGTACADCLPGAHRIACTEAADRAMQVCQLLSGGGR